MPREIDRDVTSLWRPDCCTLPYSTMPVTSTIMVSMISLLKVPLVKA